MQKLLDLKNKGYRLKDLVTMTEPKTSEATLSRHLRKFCLETGQEYSRNKCGRKRIKLTIKDNNK